MKTLTMNDPDTCVQTSATAASFVVIVPTYNAAKHWKDIEESMRAQCVEPANVLIIDSSSTDDTIELARLSGFRAVQIPKEQFGHGRTRQLAATLSADAEYLVYITQDAAIREPGSLQRLLSALADTEVGAAYGRQLPRPQARAIERHARLFNYPDESAIRAFEDRRKLGVRAAFLSNSFAVYRRRALESVGGFPPNVILGEDFYVGAKMLMNGWKLAYQADATAVHSHEFSPWEELKRYFDIGVHHSRETWMLDTFGSPDDEGKKFVRSEFKYVCTHECTLLPAALLQTAAKLIGYRLGRMAHRMPGALARVFSSNRMFWS